MVVKACIMPAPGRKQRWPICRLRDSLIYFLSATLARIWAILRRLHLRYISSLRLAWAT